MRCLSFSGLRVEEGKVAVKLFLFLLCSPFTFKISWMERYSITSVQHRLGRITLNRQNGEMYCRDFYCFVFLFTLLNVNKKLKIKIHKNK